MNRFENKVAIVTGSGGGIGQAYVEALAREGAAVVVADINVEGRAKGRQRHQGPERRHGVDAFDASYLEPPGSNAAEATLLEFGWHRESPATMPRSPSPADEARLPRHRRLGLLQEVHEREHGRGAAAATRKWPSGAAGRSSTSPRPRRGCTPTSTAWAKVGVNGLTQQLSRELGGQNIRINAIAPGPIDTEANRTTTPQEMVADIVKGIPLSRMGTPEDLVGMCLFLLSDEASWLPAPQWTGRDHPVMSEYTKLYTGTNEETHTNMFSYCFSLSLHCRI